MIHYFEAIPAAALRREFDGNTYAVVGHRVTGGGIEACPAGRMVRADDARIESGVAYVRIGGMGEMIAQTVNLPFGVSFRSAE